MNGPSACDSMDAVPSRTNLKVVQSYFNEKLYLIIEVSQHLIKDAVQIEYRMKMVMFTFLMWLTLASLSSQSWVSSKQPPSCLVVLLSVDVVLELLCYPDFSQQLSSSLK